MFWFDHWAGDSPFAARFPDLFSIAVDPTISVERALIDLGRLTFRRPFGPSESAAWRELLDCIALHEPAVDSGPDQVRWRLEPSGQFSTKSLYQAIAPSIAPPPPGGLVHPSASEDPDIHVAMDSRTDPVWGGGPQAQRPWDGHLPALRCSRRLESHLLHVHVCSVSMELL